MFKRKRKRSREFKDTSRIIDMDQARTERRKKRTGAAEKSKGRKSGSAGQETRRKRKTKIKLLYTAIFIGIIAVVGVCSFNIVTLKMEQKDLHAQQEALEKKKAKLEYELSQINSDEYVEQQARQMLRMIRPGELLYILPSEDDKSTGGGIIPQE